MHRCERSIVARSMQHESGTDYYAEKSREKSHILQKKGQYCEGDRFFKKCIVYCVTGGRT